MTFKEWFNSTPHRAKYSSDHPAYLAAQDAWEAAHEACAKVCDGIRYSGYCPPEDGAAPDYYNGAAEECAAAIRARGETK